MNPKLTKVTMISCTSNPIETIYAQWVQSRTQTPVPSIDELIVNAAKDIKFEQEMNKIFEDVITMKMPLTETIDFVFLLENVPVALREQLVRHRIGHKFGDQLGADTIPDLAGSSSFWSQTMRIIDCSNFYDNGDYYLPEGIVEKGEGAVASYKNSLQKIQDEYRHLQNEYGIAMEDARNILPMALQHRMTWKTNLSSLLHVLGKRTCWHAQLGMWRPVIMDMIKELATKVHPCFNKLFDPPCIGKDGEFDTCVFKPENEGLVKTGNNPPCSLWIGSDFTNSEDVSIKDVEGISLAEESIEREAVGEKNWERYGVWKQKFTQLWSRDPITGKRLQVSNDGTRNS